MKDRKPLVATLAVVTTLLMVGVVVWTLRQSADDKPTYTAPPGPQASVAAPGADFEKGQ